MGEFKNCVFIGCTFTDKDGDNQREKQKRDFFRLICPVWLKIFDLLRQLKFQKFLIVIVLCGTLSGKESYKKDLVFNPIPESNTNMVDI